MHYVHYVHERAGKRGGMTKIFQLPLKGVSVVHAVLFYGYDGGEKYNSLPGRVSALRSGGLDDSE